MMTNNYEDPYQEREETGRDIFTYNVKPRGVKRIKYADYRFSRYDGTLTGRTDLTGVFEIKNRDIPDDEYNDRWLLEEKKAAPLIAAAITSGYNMALYVVITRNYIRMWDLLKLNLDYKTGHFTPSTATNYNKGGEEKSVAYLKESQLLCKIRRIDIPS